MRMISNSESPLVCTWQQPQLMHFVFEYKSIFVYFWDRWHMKDPNYEIFVLTEIYGNFYDLIEFHILHLFYNCLWFLWKRYIRPRDHNIYSKPFIIRSWNLRVDSVTIKPQTFCGLVEIKETITQSNSKKLKHWYR